MKLSQKGIELIHGSEGCVLQAYQDSRGTWTIGWGNTFYEDNSPVKEGDVITKERANELYNNIIEIFISYVNNNCANMDITLNQNQFDAFVSFAYNLGEIPLKEVLALFKTNKLDREYYVQYCHSGGKPIKGLIIRRNKEYNLISGENEDLLSYGWKYGFGGKAPEEPVVKEEPVIFNQEKPVVKENAIIEPVSMGLQDEKEKLFTVFTKTKRAGFNISTTKTIALIFAVGTIIGALQGKVDWNIVTTVLLAIIGYRQINK